MTSPWERKVARRGAVRAAWTRQEASRMKRAPRATGTSRESSRPPGGATARCSPMTGTVRLGSLMIAPLSRSSGPPRGLAHQEADAGEHDRGEAGGEDQAAPGVDAHAVDLHGALDQGEHAVQRGG